jgi:hypothetical protein
MSNYGNISTMENRSVLEQLSPIPPLVPWTPRDVSWGLGVSILGVFFLVIIGGLLQQAGLTLDPSLVIIFGTALLLIPVWYFTIYKYKATWSDLGLRGFPPRAIGMGCGLMLISFFFNLIYAAILGMFGQQIQPDIGPMFDETELPLLLLLGGAIVAPFVEEVFFRGFVFAGLRAHWGWPKAALTSAGLFALAHVVPTSILPIFILGMIFAFLYQMSASIWPAIFMHMLTNGVALSAAYAISQGWTPMPL